MERKSKKKKKKRRYMYTKASLVAQMVKNLPAIWKT